MPQLLTQFPEMIAIMQSMRTMMLTMHSTMSGIFGQMDDSNDNATAMGKAFDAAKNDDSFYMPPDVFKNADFKRVMKDILVAGREGRAYAHFAKGRSRVARGHLAGRPDKKRGRGGAQGNSARRLQDLPRRHRSDDERPGGGFHIRSHDRGSRCALPYFHHHADHHAKFCCRHWLS